MYTKYKIVPFCPYHFVHTILSIYHFVHTILSVPFCPLPFCPVTYDASHDLDDFLWAGKAYKILRTV